MLEHRPSPTASPREEAEGPRAVTSLSCLSSVSNKGHSPLLGLHVHHQGDVALDEGEGEEADVATVFPGSRGVLHSGGRGVGW